MGLGEEHFLRRNIEKATVHDLVYKYLRKCADKDGRSKLRNCACTKFQKQHVRRRDIRGRNVPATRINLDEDILSDDDFEEVQSDKTALPRRTSRSSSTECIAGYMKAVRDGRRRAKFYVREALLYGLQSGLLIPTNRQRNVLRVSQKLENCPSKKKGKRSVIYQQF